jgi:sulfite reductase (NADPH) hemoprotein beta-component
MLRALTANRLIDGEVVFWTGASWAERFSLARLFDEAEIDAAETAEAHAKTAITELVEPYLIEVAPVEGGFAPVSYRERLRALGPTNKPDHGKQAEGGADIEALAHAHGAARSKGRVELIRRK